MGNTSILDYVPKGFKLREVQRKALLDIEEAWDSADVIAIPAPVAAGKSLIGITVALWQKAKERGTSIMTSQVILQDQFEKTPPYLPVLRGRARYRCHHEYSTCEDGGDSAMGYCPNCPYLEAKNRCLAANVAVFNFHSYFFNKAYKNTIFIDEAHTLMGMIREFYTLKVWKYQHRYPQINNKADIAIWLEQKIKALEHELKHLRTKEEVDEAKYKKVVRLLEKFRIVYEAFDLNPADFFFDQTRELHKGKMREVMNIKPLTIKNINHGLWPRKKVDKILLSSATIISQDIEELGLHYRKVKILECGSPIDPEKRPFVFIPVANMGRNYQEKNIPKMAEFLKKLADKHADFKGVTHMTYSLARQFQGLLKGPRWMFHDKDNKAHKLQEFMDSPHPDILVACGMDQGIDLAGSEFQWQAIVKVQFPSLGDPMIQSQAKERPKWYVWQTIRTVQQQYGRICRTPDDYGITYMLDIGFRSIDPEDRKHLDLWPQWFLEARKTYDPASITNT